MDKSRTLTVRITPSQARILDDKAAAGGFLQRSDYVRFVLFLSRSIEDKIDQIYKKVCQDET